MTHTVEIELHGSEEVPEREFKNSDFSKPVIMVTEDLFFVGRYDFYNEEWQLLDRSVIGKHKGKYCFNWYYPITKGIAFKD